MPTVKNLILPMLSVLALSACDMPTEPEGVHQAPMTRLGEQLQARGDDAGAVDLYQRALQHNPKDLEALRNLAVILEAHGNVEAASSTTNQALEIAPDDQELLQAKGRLLIRMGRADDAKKVYEQMIDNNSHDVKALNGLGVALDYLGKHDEAEVNYRLALKEDLNNLSTLNNLAHSNMLAGRYDEAIALLESHASDKNASPALRQNLAESYGMVGRYDDAEKLSRVDLKPAEVKRNMAYYRAHSIKPVPPVHVAAAAVAAPLAASVPTQEMPTPIARAAAPVAVSASAQEAPIPLSPATAPVSKLYLADLGYYPTAQMAEAKAAAIRNLDTDTKATFAVIPEVQAIGGTPIFVLQATGFNDDESLTDFCETLIKNKINCKASKGS